MLLPNEGVIVKSKAPSLLNQGRGLGMGKNKGQIYPTPGPFPNKNREGEIIKRPCMLQTESDNKTIGYINIYFFSYIKSNLILHLYSTSI